MPEFDCCECGVHIIQFVESLPEPRLCSLCLMLPGWHNNPELRERLGRGLELKSPEDRSG